MLTVYGVTYDHTTNYGSCLQAYALQTAIESIIVNGEICSYRLIPLKLFKDYPEFVIKGNIIVKYLVKLLKILFNHHKQFTEFENKFMHYVTCSSFNELTLLNGKADAFVCGSDVIWRPEYNLGLGVYFLDFATKYKFSYAASFGKAEISNKILFQVAKWLDSFDAISVREKTSLEIARRCTKKKIKIVVDPVILLNTNEWDVVAGVSNNAKKYIFIYSTKLNSTFKEFIAKLKQQTGLDVVVATWGITNALKQGIVQVQGPELWLQLLRDAEFVITNSFHCTVFSVLYHKKFFTVVEGNKAKGSNMRMNDFLKTMDLSERLFSSVPENIDTSELNFEKSDAKIALLRKDSLAYLQENLENAFKRKNDFVQHDRT